MAIDTGNGLKKRFVVSKDIRWPENGCFGSVGAFCSSLPDAETVRCRFVKDVLQIKEKRKGPVKGRASLKEGWENGRKPVHGRLAEL